MRRTIYTAFAVLSMAALAWGARRPGYDYEIRCEVQTATAELGDLIWSQGSTPLVCAVPTKRGEYIGSDAETSVRMMIAPTATSQWWAVVTNAATNATGYLLQWPTVGTNTAASAPWYYTVYFEREGHRYWTGSGSLWIEATTATEDGLEWIEIISGDMSWVSNRFDKVEEWVSGHFLPVEDGDIAPGSITLGEVKRDTWPDFRTGGPLYPSFVQAVGVTTSLVWQYIPAGQEESMGVISASPLAMEHATMVNTARAAWTNLRSSVEGAEPRWEDTETMVWSEGDPWGWGWGTGTGFWWRVAGPCTGSWAVALGTYTGETAAVKLGSSSNYWGWTQDTPGSLREKANNDLTALWSRPKRGEYGTRPFLEWLPLLRGEGVRNTNFWAAEMDATCVSPGYSNEVSGVSGSCTTTAITKRHVLGAHHFFPETGSELMFYDGENDMFLRTLAKSERIGETDLRLGMLDEDLPQGILPARILRKEDLPLLVPSKPEGREWKFARKAGERADRIEAVHFWTPCARSVWFDAANLAKTNGEEIIAWTNASNPYVTDYWFTNSPYIGGQSGSPVLLWLDCQTVIVETLHNSTGTGPNVTQLAPLVEAKIREWGGTTETNLYWCDLERWKEEESEE